MSAIVIDASVAANWLVDEPSDERAEAALAALDTMPGLIPRLIRRHFSQALSKYAAVLAPLAFHKCFWASAAPGDSHRNISLTLLYPVFLAISCWFQRVSVRWYEMSKVVRFDNVKVCLLPKGESNVSATITIP